MIELTSRYPRLGLTQSLANPTVATRPIPGGRPRLRRAASVLWPAAIVVLVPVILVAGIVAVLAIAAPALLRRRRQRPAAEPLVLAPVVHLEAMRARPTRSACAEQYHAA